MLKSPIKQAIIPLLKFKVSLRKVMQKIHKKGVKMTRTIKDRGRKRVFNPSCVTRLDIKKSGDMLRVTMISSEVNHIGGKVIPNNFKFTCATNSDRVQIEQFFRGLNSCNFLEVKSDKTLEFKDI